jgi:hypothetical protein
MRAAGKYADGYIDNHMTNRKAQSVAYIDKLKKVIVDPLAKDLEPRRWTPLPPGLNARSRGRTSVTHCIEKNSG